MSMLLWYGQGDDDAVSVGPTLHVFGAFADMGRLLGADPEYDELQSVPGFAEQQVTPWWLGEVKRQARKLLSSGKQLTPRAREVVETLAEMRYG